MNYFIISGVALAIFFGILSQIDLRLLNIKDLNAPSSSSVVKFYDLFGALLMNDYYHYTFEEIAMRNMIEHCDIQNHQNILEIGPGSGFLAEQILQKYNVNYIGIDLSKTMSIASSKRLQSYINNGSVELYLIDNSLDFLESWKKPVDRYIFTYILDLLPDQEINQFSNILSKKLKEHNNSKVCIVNLTYGFTSFSRILTNIWQLLYTTLGGSILGGCRPIEISNYFYSDNGFYMEYLGYTVSTGLPSEIAILTSNYNKITE